MKINISLRFVDIMVKFLLKVKKNEISYFPHKNKMADLTWIVSTGIYTCT